MADSRLKEAVSGPRCACAKLMVLGQAFRKGGVPVLWGQCGFSNDGLQLTLGPK